MPSRKQPAMTDEERARRIRDLAQEAGTSDDPKAFEKAFGKFAKQAKPQSEKAKPPGQ